MWKTFRDFLWPHSNLQIKVMWAPVAGCCLATVTGSLSSGLHVFPARKSAWVPFTFDSLVYRSFSWNLIWQHPAFYKLTERRHFFKKKKMWLNLLERGIIYYYRKTRCVDKPTRLSATRGGILWNTHTVKPRKFAECVLRRAERKLSMRLLFALVPKSFSWGAKCSTHVTTYVSNLWWCRGGNPVLLCPWFAMSAWACFSPRSILTEPFAAH